MFVLTYHSISDGPPPLCVSRDGFLRHLDFLARHGYEPAPLDAVVGALGARRPLPERAFALTFDDGYGNFHDTALPILRERRLPATLFALPPPGEGAGRARVPGGTDEDLMTPQALRAVADAGVEIGAHSRAHCDLTKLLPAEIEAELAGGRSDLEALLGRPVRRFAYPFGCFDRRLRVAAQAHYEAAFTTQLGPLRDDLDRWALPRVDAFYLDSSGLQRALAAGRPERFLTPRRWLRRLRGSEPRRPIPRA